MRAVDSALQMSGAGRRLRLRITISKTHRLRPAEPYLGEAMQAGPPRSWWITEDSCLVCGPDRRRQQAAGPMPQAPGVAAARQPGGALASTGRANLDWALEGEGKEAARWAISERGGGQLVQQGHGSSGLNRAALGQRLLLVSAAFNLISLDQERLPGSRASPAGLDRDGRFSPADKGGRL